MAAGETKTVVTSPTGTVTTYVLTDGAGNTLTVVVNMLNAGSGRSTSFTSSGNLQQDGIVLLANLAQKLASETSPQQTF